MSKIKDFLLCVFFLALAALIVVIIITGISGYSKWPEKYDELQEKYSELEDKYDTLKYELWNATDKIWECEDNFCNVWCYFEEEEDVTFSEAKESFMKIYYKLLQN